MLLASSFLLILLYALNFFVQFIVAYPKLLPEEVYMKAIYFLKKLIYKYLANASSGKNKKKYYLKYEKYKDRLCEHRKISYRLDCMNYELQMLKSEIGNLKYEYFEDIIQQKILIPKIMQIDETIDYIISNKVSVARFGDGEFILMTDTNYKKEIYFNTPKNEQLILKLKEVLTSNEPNLLICIWDFFGSLEQYNDSGKQIGRMHMNNIREKIYKLLDFSRIYGNAFVTRFYIVFKDKTASEIYFNKWKSLWNGQDIYIVEGEGSRLGVGNDLFEGAKSVQRIICPAENAFDKYNEILDYIVTNLPPHRLVLIALGMTATALAYDLAKKNFWAIDIGHIDVEYEWFLQGADSPVPIKSKYVNDIGKYSFEDISSKKYEGEIIKIIR